MISLFGIFSGVAKKIDALLTFENAVTMPIFIFSQNNSRGPEWWTMSALAIIAVLPVVVMGILLERLIQKGLIFGSVK